MNTTTELTDEQISAVAEQFFSHDHPNGQEIMGFARALLQHTAAPVQQPKFKSLYVEGYEINAKGIINALGEGDLLPEEATEWIEKLIAHNAAPAQSVQPKEAGNLAITMLTHLGFLGVVLSKEQIAGIEKICNWWQSQAAPSVPEGVIQTIEQVIEWINGLPVPTTGATAKMMLLDKVVKQLAAAPAAQAPKSTMIGGFTADAVAPKDAEWKPTAAQIEHIKQRIEAAQAPVTAGEQIDLAKLVRHDPKIAPFGYDYVVEMVEREDGEWVRFADVEDAATSAAQAPEKDVLNPVEGDLLPPIGSKVLIHLASRDEWVEHTVAGYYVWGALSHQVQGDPKGSHAHRVFVRVRDANGYLNARLLNEVKPVAAMQENGNTGSEG